MVITVRGSGLILDSGIIEYIVDKFLKFAGIGMNLIDETAEDSATLTADRVRYQLGVAHDSVGGLGNLMHYIVYEVGFLAVGKIGLLPRNDHGLLLLT